MQPNKRPSLQEINRRRQSDAFVGREEQIIMFTNNLALSLENEQRRFIFAVSGQGGVGKTSLLRRLRRISEENQAVCTFTDDIETDVPSVLAKMADQLKGQGFSFDDFEKQHQKYLQLVQEPATMLTPLFLTHLNEVADARQVVLFFDTFERTSSFLEDWLLAVFDGRYGDVSLNAVWTIAGRDALVTNRWELFGGLIAGLPLEPFSDEQARAYLVRKGIQNEQAIEVILNISGRLPLLVAMLAEQSPNDPALVGNATDTAVDRFLKWIDDPSQRQIAIDAALPRTFNHDIIGLLVEPDKQDTMFRWLISQPFITKRGDGWAYHEVVRSQMLRYKLRESPEEWVELHKELTNHYHTGCETLGIELHQAKKNETWQAYWLEQHYHQLAQHLAIAQPFALGVFLESWQKLHRLAHRWAVLMQMAGKDFQVPSLLQWGHRLSGSADFYQQSHYAELLTLFSEILKEPELFADHRVLGIAWQGDMYRLLGRYEEALAVFARALELNPNSAWAIGSRGQVYRMLERYEEALADFTQAIELDSSLIWTIGERGIVYHQMGRYEEALGDFTQTIELQPEYTWAIAQRGVSYAKMGRYEEALTDLTHAAGLGGRNAYWVFGNRGMIYRQMRCYEEAIADLTRAIELEPNQGWILSYRGDSYRMLERYEEAVADLSQAVELDPNTIWPLSHRGRAYREMKRYDEALADFTRAIELAPQDAGRFGSRGMTYWQMRCYEEAIADLTRAIELEPNQGWILSYRGDSYRMLERYEEALADLSQAVELDPNIGWPLIRRGLTYRQLRRYEETLVDLTRALEHKPHYMQAIGERALTYRQIGHYEEALADFNRRLELNANDAWVVGQRGATYREMGRYKEALADFTRAIELDRNNAWVIDQRGDVYREMKRYQEALADFKRAIELNENNTWAICRCGEMYRQMGRYEEAFTAISHALELDQKNDWRHYLIATIYEVLCQQDQASAALMTAIGLARTTYAINKPDWSNTFNLVVYLAYASQAEEAITIIQDALADNPPLRAIRVAIQDFDELLQTFPAHTVTREMRAMLEKHLANTEGNSPDSDNS